MIDRDIAEKKARKQSRDVKLISLTINHHSMPHPVTTPSDHTYWRHALITPTSHIFKPYISFFWCKRNVRLKIVASGCDQCVWAVGVVTGWDIESWLVVRLINLTSLPCFRTFFQLHHGQSSTLHSMSFFQTNFVVVISVLFLSTKLFGIIIM